MRSSKTAYRKNNSSLVAGILSVLLCLTLISFWMLGNLYAKYTSQGAGEDSARVAVFSITDSNTLTKDFAIALDGVTTRDIQVTIHNKSEVAVRYKMEFTSDGNLPLKITASAANGDTITKDENGEMIWTVDKAADGNRSTSDEYTFTVQLSDADYTNAGGVANLTLAVTAEQID